MEPVASEQQGAAQDQVPDGQPVADSNDSRRQSWRHNWRRLLLGAGIVSCAIAVVVLGLDKQRRRDRHRKHRPGAPGNQQKGGSEDEESQAVHIPLKEVVRFKERQWFLEDLELSREGDSNAMLRLAKMYLHGQGCKQSLPMAQEWLRKARQLGLYGTLDELWGGEAQGLEDLKRDTFRQGERRRSLAMQTQTALASQAARPPAAAQ